MIPDVFCISAPSLFRHFTEEVKEKFNVFTERKLTEDYETLCIDGKAFMQGFAQRFKKEGILIEQMSSFDH